MMRKKILAAVLSVVMVVGSLNMGVSAASTNANNTNLSTDLVQESSENVTEVIDMCGRKWVAGSYNSKGKLVENNNRIALPEAIKVNPNEKYEIILPDASLKMIVRVTLSTGKSKEYTYGNKYTFSLPLGATCRFTIYNSKDASFTFEDFARLVNDGNEFGVVLKKDKVTVTFETNGGSEVEKQTVNSGNKAVCPEDPTKEGYDFVGWYTDAEFTKEFSFDTAISKDLVLYAAWEESVNSDNDDTDVDYTNDFVPEEAEPEFNSFIDELMNLMELNDGDIPYVEYDENEVPYIIDGKFSDTKVTSCDDAIEALNSIHYVMGFENASQEFVGVSSSSINDGDTNYYRLQQMYHGVPVKGYQLIVSSNAEGEVLSVNGHYYPNVDIDVNPSITMEEAKAVVANVTEEKAVSQGVFVEVVGEEPVLVWIINTMKNAYYIDAQTGGITDVKTLVREEVGTGTDYDGNSITFPVKKSWFKYYLTDTSSNISVSNANHKNVTSYPAVKNGKNSWGSYTNAITAYANVLKVYNYYGTVLGYAGMDGNNKALTVVTDYRENDSTEYNNAFYSSSKNIIAIGDSRSSSRVRSLDTIGHEYTHGVNNYRWDPEYINESGALDESYADIMGNLIEDGALFEHGEHQIYPSTAKDSYGNPKTATRDFSDPARFGDANDLASHTAFCYLTGHHDCSCGDSADHSCDKGGVHSNSGILNHAAYYMDQNWPTPNHAKELTALFFNSMNYLTNKATFIECRYALLKAARRMGFGSDKETVIAQALTDVGIEPNNIIPSGGAHQIKGVLKSAADNRPIINGSIVAYKKNSILKFSLSNSDDNGSFNVNVTPGTYSIIVSAYGYKSQVIDNIEIKNEASYSKYVGTIYMTPDTWADNDNVFATGKVTHALTGKNLSDVTIKFRKGNNITTGAYVTNAVGNVIELTTDNLGEYYTAGLPAGNYTLEASKDGFITGYINVVSGASSVCYNQNISLTPALTGDKIRIVLTWGADPRDLDSHTYGTLSSGSNFHVYYGSKSSYDHSVEICNLDVDDTTGYGPETTTLLPESSKPYYFYVYHFSGSESIATSNAKVKVYQGSELIGEFNAPTDQGTARYWNVFAVVNGSIVERNTITSSADITYANVTAKSSRSVSTFAMMSLMDDSDDVIDTMDPKNWPSKEEVETIEISDVEEMTSESLEVDSEIVEDGVVE